MVKIIFLNNKGIIIPKLIELITWSGYDHCEIICSDGINSISALEFHGVIKRPLSKVKDKAKDWVVVEYPANITKTEAFLNTQIGRSYDYLGAIGLGFHADWDTKKNWWCSEIDYVGLVKGGFQAYRDGYSDRITPEDLYKLNYNIVDKSKG